MAATSDVLVTHGLRKEYPGTGKKPQPMTALDGLDLVLKEHEIACVVGPSGCGKSTLLNLFAGFERPSAGELTFRGEKIEGPDPSRGVVFQQPALFRGPPWSRT